MTQSSWIRPSSSDASCCTNAWLKRWMICKVWDGRVSMVLSYTSVATTSRSRHRVPSRAGPKLIGSPEFFAGELPDGCTVGSHARGARHGRAVFQRRVRGAVAICHAGGGTTRSEDFAG